MREIKFRAWDGLKMRQSNRILVDSLDGAILNNEKDDYEPNWILMQYTGLKDKNGKEIYEGDVLAVRELHDGHERYWKQPTGPAIPTEVKWDNEYLSWEIPLNSYHFEVIGNIYENPELLK